MLLGTCVKKFLTKSAAKIPLVKHTSVLFILFIYLSSVIVNDEPPH